MLSSSPLREIKVAKTRSVQALGNVTLATRPVTLTVGVETELWLWVERGSTDTDHTVYARLAQAISSIPISGQLIKFDVDGMPYAGTTDPDGYVAQLLNLVAVGGEATTYQVKAVFEGAGFKTRNLTITDPYGQDYLVCTTLQWDYKASQNSVTLMVEAPKTDTTASTSDENATVTQNEEAATATTPPILEQIQQEAEQRSSSHRTREADNYF